MCQLSALLFTFILEYIRDLKCIQAEYEAKSADGAMEYKNNQKIQIDVDSPWSCKMRQRHFFISQEFFSLTENNFT